MNSALFSSATDLWETPQDFFEKLNGEFGFTLDPCATRENAKCKMFFTKKEDGLQQDWGGHIVFCNPPYGRELPKWVEKAYEESRKPGTTVVMLIPARTDTRYFHEYIYHNATEIRFLKGRLKFGSAKHSAPFPSMVVIYASARTEKTKTFKKTEHISTLRQGQVSDEGDNFAKGKNPKTITKQQTKPT